MWLRKLYPWLNLQIPYIFQDHQNPKMRFSTTLLEHFTIIELKSRWFDSMLLSTQKWLKHYAISKSKHKRGQRLNLFTLCLLYTKKQLIPHELTTTEGMKVPRFESASEVLISPETCQKIKVSVPTFMALPTSLRRIKKIESRKPGHACMHRSQSAYQT